MGTKMRLNYYIILSTKYLEPALQGIENAVYQAFREAEKILPFSILDIRIEDGNRIHLIISSPPQNSVSYIVKSLKDYTFKYLWKTEGDKLEKFYGKKRRLWHGGYVADAVGATTIQAVLEPLSNKDEQPETKEPSIKDAEQ